MNSEAKISLIQKTEAQLPSQNFLIFCPPNQDSLFTADEILELTTPILNQAIPPNLSNVQKSQWVKLKIIELLGYQRPSGLRTKQATQSKPKFIHQLLDIFVQSSRNLQVWNYVPYSDSIIPSEWNIDSESPYRYKDCRYLLVFHNPERVILKTTLVDGSKLAEWDTTGTQTIKWQASTRRSYRNEISSQIIVNPIEALHNKISTYMQQPLEEKSRFIIQESQNLESPLIKHPPTPTSFLTHNEIAQALRTLVGREFANLGTGQERGMGQILEKEVIRTLGYQSYQQTDTGGYPDLLHQLIEVKFQFRDTIDLGKHLPTDPLPIEAPWNKWEIAPREIRYVVALMEQGIQGNFIVDSIVITSGAKFNEYFSISEGTNSKVQIRVPLSIMP